MKEEKSGDAGPAHFEGLHNHFQCLVSTYHYFIISCQKYSSEQNNSILNDITFCC